MEEEEEEETNVLRKRNNHDKNNASPRDTGERRETPQPHPSKDVQN